MSNTKIKAEIDDILIKNIVRDLFEKDTSL